MNLLNLDEITIPANRIRREFDEEKLNELAESIRTKGLLHAIVTRGDDQLVAGERRIRAIKSLTDAGQTFRYNGTSVAPGCVPATDIGDLTPLEAREAEYEENAIRTDLTLAEKAQAIKALHDLRAEQTKGDRTKQATAEEIGKSKAHVGHMLTIAQHLDDPDVAKAAATGSPKEAMRVIRKKHEKWLEQELAQNYAVEPKLEAFFNASFTELTVEDYFDCIIADGPYGVGADTFGSQSALGHSYEDTPQKFKDTFLKLAPAVTRASRVESHLYIFCDARRFADLSKLFESFGWRVWPKPIIWVKGNGMLPEPHYGPRYTYECILFANKGLKHVTATHPDVITCPAVSGMKLIHAAQKPVEVYSNLLRRSCMLGDRVWDPMAGSGTMFLAAKELGLQATGHEVDPANYAAALARLEEEL